MQGAEISQSF